MFRAMHRTRHVWWLVAAMCWTVFAGAANGLILCLHADLRVHLESDASAVEDCAETCAHEDMEATLVNAWETADCLDLALQANNLPLLREGQAIPRIPAPEPITAMTLETTARMPDHAAWTALDPGLSWARKVSEMHPRRSVVFLI